MRRGDHSRLEEWARLTDASLPDDDAEDDDARSSVSDHSRTT
jgi:hypothetical protein